MISVFAIVADSTTIPWHPLPLPKSALLAIVPPGLPYAGQTLIRVARRDPAAISTIAANAPDPRLRDLAKRVRGHLTGGRHV